MPSARNPTSTAPPETGIFSSVTFFQSFPFSVISQANVILPLTAYICRTLKSPLPFIYAVMSYSPSGSPTYGVVLTSWDILPAKSTVSVSARPYFPVTAFPLFLMGELPFSTVFFHPARDDADTRSASKLPFLM